MEELYPYVFSLPQTFSLVRKIRLFSQFNTLTDLAEYVFRLIEREELKKIFLKAEGILKLCEKLEISTLHFYEHDFPVLLKKIYDPPITLYYRGNRELLSMPSVSVVGTRKASKLALFATGFIPKFLSHNNISAIVSGMALGIDREAMKAALQNNVPVIGVLGTGIDEEYPFQNRDLYKEMRNSKNALILSEIFPGKNLIRNYSFIHRNRIITGLSDLTIIMEAPAKSGAMSSANHAITQHRELLVFDHENLTQNQGGRQLIQDGARTLTLEEITNSKCNVFHISEIIPSAFSAVPSVLAYLSSLEFNGLVKDLGGGYYYKVLSEEEQNLATNI
ncbi:MAG: DNA-protecting protein DprA [Leptospira sp.]|nr:DNA-protecting protein DprA [Leptospira sp.]